MRKDRYTNADGSIEHVIMPEHPWEHKLANRHLRWSAYRQAYTDDGQPWKWDAFTRDYNKVLDFKSNVFRGGNGDGL